MTGSKRKKKSRKRATKPAIDDLPDQLRRGMPARDNIRKVVDFTSPQGEHYKILKTTETDVYDPVPAPKKKRKPKK
ncbi:MAG TPA: hypothetical protein VE133_02260 [Candidatus Sulfotelmatobacter sp.]|jgi:hypothetical protein|nr:hypothetical protein [Candidatus Sulfotelmatobacter sp.]